MLAAVAGTLLCIVLISFFEPVRSTCFTSSACTGCGGKIFDCCLGSVVEKQSAVQYAGYIQSNGTLVVQAPGAGTFFVAQNGSVWTNRSLDGHQTPCWVFTIATMPQGQTTIYAVGVIDINDYPPVIVGLPTIVNMSATNKVGGINLCYPVTDMDAGTYGNVSTVQVVAGDSTNLFAVALNRASQPPQACIFNNASIDGRTVSWFNLTILAVDQGVPPLSSATWIVVQLTGVNYYAPVFLALQPLRPVPDNTPVGTVIQSFLATDNNTGPTGKIVYSIQSVVPQTSIFTINQTTGALVLFSPFVPATSISRYNVCVTATDSSPTFPLSSSVCTAIMVVLGTPPSVTLLSSSSLCPVSIAENVPNAQVTRLYYSTNDMVQGNILQGSSNFTASCSVPFSGYYQCTVTVNGYLDFEKASQLDITIGVTWSGVLPLDNNSLLALYYNTTCTVNVIDTNDNAPQLNKTRFSFLEKQPLGSYVAQLVGYDPDQGESGVVGTYALVRVTNATTDLTSLGLFDLDSRTGLLTTKGVIERRVVGKELNVTVNVTDSGSLPLTSVITVQLEVIGALAFTTNSYAFVVFKSMPAPVTVGRVEAMVDDYSSSTVSYQLMMNSTYFTVDAQGNVTAKAPFNSVAHYQFMVLAVDGGSPPVSSSAMVAVDVLDVCSGTRNLTIPSTSTVGQYLGSVLSGTGNSPALNYRINSEIFVINPTSGVVAVKSVPSQWNSSYIVILVAFNPNFTSVSTDCTLAVTVSMVTPVAVEALAIGASVGSALLLLVCLCVVMVAFHFYRRRHRDKLNFLAASRRVSVKFSDLTDGSRASSPPKGILSPVASKCENKTDSDPVASNCEAKTVSPSKSNPRHGSVKFSYTADLFLVDQQESVAQADTTTKQHSNVKFSPTVPRAQCVESLPGMSSPPVECNPPHTNPLPLYPPSSHPAPRPTMGYPPTHEDMLDHSLATNAGHTHLSDANSCDDSTYSDNTSTRNSIIPRFNQGSDEALAHYAGPTPHRLSPPSFLPPAGMRGVPPASSFSRHHRSPTPPQHSSSSRSSTPPRRDIAPMLLGPPQMVPQPGPPPTYYPDVMPSALDHSEMSSVSQGGDYTAESDASSVLDDVLRYSEGGMEQDFYNLTYNDEGSDV